MMYLAQAVTIDPTQSANINAAVGSIPTTASSFVLVNLQNAMPFILLLLGIGVAYFVITWGIHKAKGHL